MDKKLYPPATELWLILFGLGHLWLLINMGEPGRPGCLRVFQAVLGILYGLFVPGYLVQLSLYPRRGEIEGYTRLVLSLGLSIAVLSPLALILNLLEGGLLPTPFTSTWLGLTLALLILAGLRQLKVPLQERAGLRFHLPLHEAWQEGTRAVRILLVIVGFFLLLGIGAGLGLAFSPSPGSAFTEFYILGDGGMAEGYPTDLNVNQPAEIIVGIHNLEGKTMLYAVEAYDRSGVIGRVDGIILEDGEWKEFQLVFTPQRVGTDLPIELVLFRYGLTAPYRSLRLKTTVTEETAGGTSDG